MPSSSDKILQFDYRQHNKMQCQPNDSTITTAQITQLHYQTLTLNQWQEMLFFRHTASYSGQLQTSNQHENHALTMSAPPEILEVLVGQRGRGFHRVTSIFKAQYL